MTEEKSWDVIQGTLQQLTPENEIHWKCQSINQATGKATMVAYTDARLPRKILDEAVGIHGWEVTYNRDTQGVLFCSLTITFPDGTKVTKQDCGVPSDFEKDKGEVSDAFKRACFTWGICADLYDLDIHWVDCEKKADGSWKAPWNWTPPSAKQKKKEALADAVKTEADLKGIRHEMQHGEYHEVLNNNEDEADMNDTVDDLQYSTDPEFAIGDQVSNGFQDWKLNGRRQEIGYTNDNKHTAWKDIGADLLIWTISKMSTKREDGSEIKIAKERQERASKEILTRMHEKSWSFVHDKLTLEQVQGLAMTIIQA
ncbi:MAG: hypothetical protein JKY75_05525 [Erythrobacter sp.]|nr:hypothetical protein [Erythrobacter sp.]